MAQSRGSRQMSSRGRFSLTVTSTTGKTTPPWQEGFSFLSTGALCRRYSQTWTSNAICSGLKSTSSATGTYSWAAFIYDTGTTTTRMRKISHQNNRDERQKHVLLAGDFICSDLDWSTGAIKAGASERSVQQALVDITYATHLSQVHEEPIKEEYILDLVFTSNPTLNKSSKSVPGISDHLSLRL